MDKNKPNFITRLFQKLKSNDSLKTGMILSVMFYLTFYLYGSAVPIITFFIILYQEWLLIKIYEPEFLDNKKITIMNIMKAFYSVLSGILMYMLKYFLLAIAIPIIFACMKNFLTNKEGKKTKWGIGTIVVCAIVMILLLLDQDLYTFSKLAQLFQKF